MITEVQPACEGNDSTFTINKLISNIELAFELMQRDVDSLIKIHREKNAFNIISEIKSMYQPYIKKKAPFALHRSKTKLGTLESSPSESIDKFTVDSCVDSEKAESVIYSKSLGETKPPNDVDVTTHNPCLNSVPSLAHDATPC